MTKTPKKPGRPSSYTQEIADEICERLANGESLRQICDPETRDDFMPGRSAVLQWLEDNLEFRAKYERAREAQADAMDDKILTVADACVPDTAAADRVKIDAYKWRASKLAPKKYGDKQLVGSDPENPLPQGFTVNLVKNLVKNG